MTTRVQVVLSREERELFHRQAAAEGMSLSAWFRRAAHRSIESASERRRLDSAERLRAFFAECDARETGREPDWGEHLEVMRQSRRPRVLGHVIFVDTNVFMYAVGRPHPLRDDARRFFEQAAEDDATVLCTSAEVLQELVHAYLPVERLATLDAALALAESAAAEIWPIEPDDVRMARDLVRRHAALGARDLLHLACCLRRKVDHIRTFDRGLATALER